MAKRSYVDFFVQDLANTGAVVLVIDGINLDIQPLDHTRYMTNIFCQSTHLIFQFSDCAYDASQLPSAARTIPVQ